MVSQSKHGLARWSVPNFNHTIVAPRDKSCPVWRKTTSIDLVIMANKRPKTYRSQDKRRHIAVFAFWIDFVFLFYDSNFANILHKTFINWHIPLWDKAKFGPNVSNLKSSLQLNFAIIYNNASESSSSCSCWHFLKLKSSILTFSRTKNSK